MGEMSVIDRPPIWRTPLAVAIVAWMVLACTVTLAAARLMEVTPEGSAPIVITAIYIVPPPLLLGWSFWAMLREPVTGWLAPTVLMTFVGGFVPLFHPLYQAGIRMNFEARRPAYEAIVAEAKAGRLVGVAGRRGWVHGLSGDIRYRYRPTDPGTVDFIWTRAYGFRAGILHDDTPCVARKGYSCLSRGEALDARYSYYARVF